MVLTVHPYRRQCYAQMERASASTRRHAGLHTPGVEMTRRRPFVAATLLVAGWVAGMGAQGGPANRADNHEADFLTRIRKLTVEGRRAGEGYWAPDGSALVFQSEREPGNPFYQIYTLDLGTGDTMRVSPGTGKTTCAFFRPGTDQILFASTHHDPKSLQYQKEIGRAHV